MKGVFSIIVVASFIRCLVASACKSSTYGKEFAFGILDSIGDCCKDDYNIVELDITNVSPNQAVVTLQIPYLQIDTKYTLPIAQNKTISIDASIQKDGTFVGKRGIKIISNNEISVIVTTSYYFEASTESYNVLPKSSLGKSFLLSSHESDTVNRGGEVIVSAPSNNTDVKIYQGNRILQSETINEFDVFQYTCSKCDLTGVMVMSTKNVYVVSGTAFTNIPSTSGQDEFIASEMIPTTSWSSKYIVPPAFPKSAFMLRIQSRDEILRVNVENRTHTYSYKLSLSKLYFGNEPVTVIANDSFSVTQYGVGYDFDNINGDPFMAVVPGVDQYLNDYKFSVPVGYYDVKSYVAIIIPRLHQTGLTLDGVSMNAYHNGPRKTFNVPYPFDSYVINVFEIKAGYHHFAHSLQWIKFGVFVYGLGRHIYSGILYGLGYGFYPGYDLTGSCLLSTPLPTHTVTATTSTTSHTQTTRAITETPRMFGPTCYNCDDLTHIGLCDTVHRCNTNEICFIERFEQSGRMRYIAGCIEEKTCYLKRNDSNGSEDLCFDCCHGNFCNNKGCDENDIPDRQNRGPICFDCEHVRSPAECEHITPCESHQSCSVEEYKWFGSTHFKLGCGHGSCGLESDEGIVSLKRATPICHSCCTEDYCNKNCTTHEHGGSIIIG